MKNEPPDTMPRKVKLYLKTDHELTDDRNKARHYDHAEATRIARKWTGNGIVAVVENVLDMWEIEAAGLAMHGQPHSFRVHIADTYTL